VLQGVPLSTGMFDIFFLIFFLYEVLRVKTREHLVPCLSNKGTPSFCTRFCALKQGNKVFPCLTNKEQGVPLFDEQGNKGFPCFKGGQYILRAVPPNVFFN
jgi:hypothetical protein